MKNVSATTMRMTIRNILKQQGLKLSDALGLSVIKSNFRYDFQYIDDNNDSLYIRRIDKSNNNKIFMFDKLEDGYEIVEIEIDRNLVAFICS